MRLWAPQSASSQTPAGDLDARPRWRGLTPRTGFLSVVERVTAGCCRVSSCSAFHCRASQPTPVGHQGAQEGALCRDPAEPPPFCPKAHTGLFLAAHTSQRVAAALLAKLTCQLWHPKSLVEKEVEKTK